jgi:hypothetical protein
MDWNVARVGMPVLLASVLEGPWGRGSTSENASSPG